MGAKTGIEWCDSTWNPLRGCSRVSSGCERCYAERVAARFSGHGQPYEGLAVMRNGKPQWTGELRLVERHLEDPLRWQKPRKIFVNSMSDLFHEKVPFEWLDRIFAVMALSPQHTFQILTKRPKRMLEYLADEATPFRVSRQMDAVLAAKPETEELRPIAGYPGYLASSWGFIYSDKRGPRRRMKPDVSDQGHQRVQLHREGCEARGERRLVHRLILETFVGQAPREESQGCHRDGNPSNNAVSNLSWGSQRENWDDSKRHGSHRRYCKLTSEQVEEIRRRYGGESRASLGRAFGISDAQVRNIGTRKQWTTKTAIEWPLPHCWLGVSVEDQATADERIPLLLQTPAAVRFVSYEPALGPVDFPRTIPCGYYCDESVGHVDHGPNGNLGGIAWIIAGGESGPRARPAHPEWFRNVRDDCQTAGVPFFFKQWGEYVEGVSGPLSVHGRLLDGREHNEFPEGSR